MRFLTYWIICIMFAMWAVLERFMAGIGKGMLGSGSLMFWVLIGFSFFFLLSAYGSMIEDRGTQSPPPADDNPF